MNKRLRKGLVQKAMKAAEAVSSNAYSPYVRHLMGAALVTDDGRIFVGTNVDSPRGGQKICAERAAICRAVSDGLATHQIVHVAIYLRGEGHAPWPCEICCNMLEDFADAECVVISASYDQEQEERGLAELIAARRS